MSDSAPGSGSGLGSNPLEIPQVAAARARGRSRLLDLLLLSRRRRREQIRRIEEKTGRTLLCYVSRSRLIAYEDAYQLHRLLQTVEPGRPITLLLNSPGGEIDPAEKMVHLLRETGSRSPDALQVVVPDFAKSAATLLALGADRIVMSDFSELGPIDPQFRLVSGLRVSIFAYLRAYDEAERRNSEHPENRVFADAFARFDPVLIAAMRQAESRTRACAENLLRRRKVNYTNVVKDLMDIKRFPSHGQMIDWRTAWDIGLREVVVHEDSRSELWRMYWRLYRELAAVCGTIGGSSNPGDCPSSLDSAARRRSLAGRRARMPGTLDTPYDGCSARSSNFDSE